MAANSSIILTELDFANLKESLKASMKAQNLFRDYDFDGSNINVLLDILAYNTYQNEGLPPGPICNPGMDSILGVLQPAATDYIYFVADPSEDGSHLFAVDPASQDQNINYRNGVVDSPAVCSNPWDDGCPLNESGGYIPENDLAVMADPRG